VNAERDESQQYHHDPDEGETHGAERDGEHDPHDPLNTPLEDAPAAAPGQDPKKEGMGGNPPARGERVARRPMPPQDD
jgi:hypothetical protein